MEGSVAVAKQNIDAVGGIHSYNVEFAHAAQIGNSYITCVRTSFSVGLGCLEGSVPLTQQHDNLRAVVVRSHNVELSVAIQIRHCDRTGIYGNLGRKRLLEGSVAVAQKQVDSLTVEVRCDDVQNSIAVKVADSDSCNHRSLVVIALLLESSIAVAQNDPD